MKRQDLFHKKTSDFPAQRILRCFLFKAQRLLELFSCNETAKIGNFFLNKGIKREFLEKIDYFLMDKQMKLKRKTLK